MQFRLLEHVVQQKSQKCQKNVRKTALETLKMNIFHEFLRQSCPPRRDKLNEKNIQILLPGK